VRLDDALSSNNSHRGDPFTATLKTDVNSDGYMGLPAGTRIEGIVKDVRSQRDRDPGVLELSFRRMRTPDGKSYPMDGSLIGLDNKSVEHTSDGRLVAKPGHKNDRLTYVGYGAGAGLIVGLLTKKPLEDTVIGAGLGYLFGSLEKSNNNPKNVSLKPGTEMGVRIDSRLSVAGYDNGYNSDDNNYGDGGRYHRTGNDGNRRDRANDITVLLDQDNVRFSSNAPPMVVNGVTMIPAIPVLRAAHVPYTYDSARQQLTTNGDAGTMRLSVGSRVAVMDNSRRINLNGTARQMNGTLYVPARFLGLALGSDVQYNEETRTLVLMPTEERRPYRRP